MSFSQQHTQFKIFDKSIKDLRSKEAALIGNLILRGEEKDVEQAIALVKKNPTLLHCKMKAVDPLGRYTAEITILEAAFMAGDVDLKPGIPNDRDRGIAERLIAAGNLSAEAVAEQLQIITSEKAQLENEARNNRLLAAIRRFGEGICNVKEAKNFVEFQQCCEPLLAQLNKDLQDEAKRVITAGYIFDPIILQRAVHWFEDNVKKFGGYETMQSNMFWAGFRKLQSQLSSRDAQVVGADISSLVNDGKIPRRTLQNPGTIYKNSSPHVGYFPPRIVGPTALWKAYIKQKRRSVMHCLDNQSRTASYCSVM